MYPVIIAIFLIFYNYSFCQERVIIEKKGNIYHVETYEEPEYNSRNILKKKQINKRLKYYIAPKKGKVFHRPNCKFARKIKHKVKFKTRQKALNKGLRPCKVCKP